MWIGVPKEIEDSEIRAGMTPACVAAPVAGSTTVSGATRIFAAGTVRTEVSWAEALE
jgi:alanine dehydrogenase